METENQSAPETVVQTSTETASPSQSSDIPSTGSMQSASEAVEAPETPAYTPNYKIKAYDSEYEIPENFRGYINKDNEKNFREVFEKAFAIDVMKGKLEKTRSENESLSKVKGEYENISKNLAQASKYIQNKDFDSFLKVAQISEKDLQQWMYNKLRQGDLPPEAQSAIQKNQEYLQKQYELEAQNETFRSELESIKQQQTQFSVAKRSQELDSVLNRPEISSVMKNFDSSLGQDGAFRNEVIRRAAFEAQSSGKDMSAEDAVNEVLKIVAWNKENSSSEDGDRVLPPQAGQKKPTLPNMQGKATSPVGQKVKTLDDLKKLRKQSIHIENN